MCQKISNFFLNQSYLGSGMQEMAINEIFVVVMYACGVKSSVCTALGEILSCNFCKYDTPYSAF